MAARVTDTIEDHVMHCREVIGGPGGGLGGHSMTSSARPTGEGGTSRPRALAVLRLITVGVSLMPEQETRPNFRRVKCGQHR